MACFSVHGLFYVERFAPFNQIVIDLTDVLVWSINIFSGGFMGRANGQSFVVFAKMASQLLLEKLAEARVTMEGEIAGLGGLSDVSVEKRFVKMIIDSAVVQMGASIYTASESCESLMELAVKAGAKRVASVRVSTTSGFLKKTLGDQLPHLAERLFTVMPESDEFRAAEKTVDFFVFGDGSVILHSKRVSGSMRLGSLLHSMANGLDDYSSSKIDDLIVMMKRQLKGIRPNLTADFPLVSASDIEALTGASIFGFVGQIADFGNEMVAAATLEDVISHFEIYDESFNFGALSASKWAPGVEMTVNGQACSGPSEFGSMVVERLFEKPPSLDDVSALLGGLAKKARKGNKP